MAYETTDELVALLSHHWYKQPDGNIYKLFDVYNSGMERVSDAGDKVMKWRGIQDAEGTTLDLFGSDIKTYRPTKDDKSYRFLIYLKMLLSRAQGTIPSIVKITSTALGTDQGIKIWKTDTPRHVCISLPYDKLDNWQLEKFLLNNLQNMLSLGYWLDAIVLVASTELPIYIGIGTQYTGVETSSSSIIWWEGWKAKTETGFYFATASPYQHNTLEQSSLKWWNGWKTKSTVQMSLTPVGLMTRATMWRSDLKTV